MSNPAHADPSRNGTTERQYRNDGARCSEDPGPGWNSGFLFGLRRVDSFVGCSFRLEIRGFRCLHQWFPGFPSSIPPRANPLAAAPFVSQDFSSESIRRSGFLVAYVAAV